MREVPAHNPIPGLWQVFLGIFGLYVGIKMSKQARCPMWINELRKKGGEQGILNQAENRTTKLGKNKGFLISEE